MRRASNRIDGSDEGPTPPGASGELRRRLRLAAAAILIGGILISLASAVVWRSRVSARDTQAFNTTASDVAQKLGVLLRRDADFITAERAVLTMEPGMSTARFERWFTELQGSQRLAGGLGSIYVARVRAPALAAFKARRAAEPAFRALVDGAVLPVKSAGAGQQCLLAGGALPSPLNATLAQILQGDWCAPSSLIGGSQGPLLRAQTDTAQLFLAPAAGQGVNTILFERSFYTLGAEQLATVAQRRAAVAGWVVTSFDIPSIMRLASQGHGDLGVALYQTNPGARPVLIGHSGAVSTGSLSHTTALNVDGKWAVTVSGTPIANGVSANTAAALVLIVGLVITVLLWALVLVLTRSRERALGMVHEKTGELRHQALHDSLTGLPNRVLALDRAQQMLARARRQRIPVAALYVDIDAFKNVNDSFGHAAGDELLQIVASRLLTVVREGDTAARLGGDEFVVLLDGSTLDAGAELVAQRLLEVLRQPYELSGTDGRRLSVTASIGIASGARSDADELLRDADLALYSAKEAGRDRYAVFASSMQETSRDRLTLEMDLGEALDRGQLFVVYQPTFDLRSRQVTGVEALARWQHPTRGVLNPDDFIPVAESSGLIIPIGRWVLNEACQQGARWRAHGHAIGVAVNVSARQLESDDMIEDVRLALQRSGLDAQALTLEVTETALMRDKSATAERLRALKALGARIAIDDFGTGYSSLAYLRQFPADALKIDRSFIDGIATSKGSAALIHTLVELGRTLGIETLAEGIEDPAQLETLQREHCDQGQGFLFSRPLDVTAVEDFLDSVEPLPVRLGPDPDVLPDDADVPWPLAPTAGHRSGP